MIAFFGIVVPSTDPFFLAVVGVHILFGLICATSGLVAMLAIKGSRRHVAFGKVYYYGMAALFLTMSILVATRWREDYHLFLLGALAFLLVIAGRRAVRSSNLRFHAVFMGSSYIVMLTAFYVDNGKNLPVWRSLPELAYWVIPAIVGVPLILRALWKHPLLRAASRS